MLRRIVLGSLLGVLLAMPVAADPWQAYAELLSRHTRETQDLAQTRVDYAALRRDPAWPAFLAELAGTHPDRLASREERLAYWINVYNAFAIDMVVKGRPAESIRDLGGRFFRKVWDQPAGVIDGRTYTLSEIEHRILRPMGDPRVHGAIVCASLSCPPLARTPYRAQTLDAQLTANLQRWLSHPQKGLRVARGERTLYVSPIFAWFEEDFERVGGVLAFVARYVTPAEREWITRHRETLRIEHLGYDWRLNHA